MQMVETVRVSEGEQGDEVKAPGDEVEGDVPPLSAEVRVLPSEMPQVSVGDIYWAVQPALAKPCVLQTEPTKARVCTASSCTDRPTLHDHH